MALELSDEILISAPRDRVYAALNNPKILQQCIPGCEELIQHSATDLEAKVVLKIGPVKARFGGKVTLDTTVACLVFLARRRVGRRRRLCKMRGHGNIGGFGRRHHAALLRKRRCRQQNRTTWQPLDYGHRAQTGGEFL